MFCFMMMAMMMMMMMKMVQENGASPSPAVVVNCCFSWDNDAFAGSVRKHYSSQMLQMLVCQ